MNLKVINISWESIPFDFDLIRTKKENHDYGVYQIYGHHPAYGQNALLYIGLAKETPFGTRLNERYEFIESCAIPITVRLGRIIMSSKEDEPLEWKKDEWGSMIYWAEKTLIKSHAPAFNKQENTGLFGDMEEHYLIMNWDDRGMLAPEVSTLRYSYKYWNYEKPLS